MLRTFISYRRDDTQASDVAQRLHERLCEKFGNKNVFFDIEKDLEYGVPLNEILGKSMEKSHVVLVLIGPDWLKIFNEVNKPTGSPSIDWVREEVRTALSLANPTSELKRIATSSDFRVIPIYIKGTEILSFFDLPADIARLAHLDSFTLDDSKGSFDEKVNELLNFLRKTYPHRWSEYRKREIKIILLLLGIAFFTFVGFWGMNQIKYKSGVNATKLITLAADPDAYVGTGDYYVNSLGMTFKPVLGHGVLCAVNKVRFTDMLSFPGFQMQLLPGEAPDDPATRVSHDDALEFCSYLTQAEHANGRLPMGLEYRLLCSDEWTTIIAAHSDINKTKTDDTFYFEVSELILEWGMNNAPANHKKAITLKKILFTDPHDKPQLRYQYKHLGRSIVGFRLVISPLKQAQN